MSASVCLSLKANKAEGFSTQCWLIPLSPSGLEGYCCRTCNFPWFQASLVVKYVFPVHITRFTSNVDRLHYRSAKYWIFRLSVMDSGVENDRVEAINTLGPRLKGRHCPDDIFKWIFLNENLCISIKISLKFVPMGPINNIPALVQIMAWRRPGDKPLSEPMIFSWLTLVCVTQPQWVKWKHIQWNMPVNTTSSIKTITCDLFRNVFYWRLKVAIYSG